jgi:hypothetical protein
MNAKSQWVVLSSPMNATRPKVTPSMSRTGCPMLATQCAAVPERAVEPLSLAARNAHDESTDRRRMR